MSVVTPSALAANQQQSHHLNGHQQQQHLSSMVSPAHSPFAFGASFPEAYPDVVTPSALAATFINDEFTLYPSPFTSQVSSATFIKTLRLRAVDKLPFWLIEPLKLTAHIFNSIEFFQQYQFDQLPDPANHASSNNPRPQLVTLSSSSVVSLTNSPPARGQTSDKPATSSSDYVDVRVYEKLMYKCLIV